MLQLLVQNDAILEILVLSHAWHLRGRWLENAALRDLDLVLDPKDRSSYMQKVLSREMLTL